MTEKTSSPPPLHGLRLVEFAGMMLADMGAAIIRIERPPRENRPTANQRSPALDFLALGRRSLALDLKTPGAIDITLRIVQGADGLIEGFRPGVMERLGLGPETCLARNPKMAYGRMTGWRQDGPRHQAAGHDLNYIALTGALWATGNTTQAPSFAMNLLGDFGGGGMLLAYGMVKGILKARRTGQGDVVDASIVDGTLALMTFIHARRAMDLWRDERGANTLDGGAPWYGVYECADGRWVAIATIEPPFWSCLLTLIGLDPIDLGDRTDPDAWPAIRKQLAAIFRSQPREHWMTRLEGTDACFAPVLSPAEAAAHPHMAARGVFTAAGPDQPMPAPRFINSTTSLPSPPPSPGAQSREILLETGLTDTDIDKLVAGGAVHEPVISDMETHP